MLKYFELELWKITIIFLNLRLGKSAAVVVRKCECKGISYSTRLLLEKQTVYFSGHKVLCSSRGSYNEIAERIALYLWYLQVELILITRRARRKAFRLSIFSLNHATNLTAGVAIYQGRIYHRKSAQSDSLFLSQDCRPEFPQVIRRISERNSGKRSSNSLDFLVCVKNKGRELNERSRKSHTLDQA